MDAKERNERQFIVSIARTYLRTPYHHQGRIKGGGIDCGMLILNVFEELGLIPHLELGVDIPFYPQDWAMHNSEEKYLSWVMKYTVKVDRDPLPGDIILHKYGHCISHGGIVVAWPSIIHAYRGLGVVYADAINDTYLQKKNGELRQAGIYSYWG